MGILKKENGFYRIEKDYGEYEEYDAEGYLVAEGDHTGEKIRIIYDKFRPVKIESNKGLYLALSFNEDGVLVRVTDSEGGEVTYGYETREEGEHKEYFLTDVTYPNGSTRKYIYDKAGRIQSVISPDGIVALKNEYDENGRVLHQVFPDGGEMSYSYDDERHIVTATEQNGLKVRYLSDELGRHIGTRYVGLDEGFTKQDDSREDEIIEEKFTYNNKSQKTSVTDKNGNTTRYSYDRGGHLTRVVGPEGLNESYTYDAEGRLLSKKDSEGNRYKYTYDFEGNLYSVTDPEGNRIKYYYKDGKIVRIKDAEENQTGIAYDENGNISSITDAAGVTLKYICDKRGRVEKTIDAEGNETLYSFDDNGNITEVIDPVGNTTSYRYTKSNLLAEVINPDGTSKVWGYNEIGEVAYFKDEEERVTDFSYNSSWNKEKMTLPNGGEINYTYDLLGNLIKVTDPEGRKTVYSHDNEGNVLSVGIESGEKKISVKTTYTYDKLGRVLSETDAEGNRTLYTYDRNGNLTCKTDALGGKTLYEYDGLQRVVKVTDAIGRTTLYTYDKNGNEETVTDPAGVVTRNHYSNDRLIKVTQKESAKESKERTIKTFEYDACGRIKTARLLGGEIVTYEYDKAGRPSVMTAPNGRVIKHVYDSMGRITEQDDCGTKTYYTYTGTGKLKSITDACGNEIIYSYNELDLLCRVERKGADSEALEAHVTTFEHDLSGKLISETDALSQKTIYAYDEAGNIKSLTDRDGNETVYTRDGNGNITGIRYMDGSEILYRYDALSALMEVKEKIGLTKIDRDILGRIVKVTDPRGEAVGYEYGARDEKTAMVYPDGKRVEYTYDAFGNLTELKEKGKDDKEQSIKYVYDDDGNLREKLFPNNTSTRYEYYKGGYIKSLVSSDRDGVLDNYEYIYNKKGNATQVTRDRRGLEGVSGIFTYSYDELGRLTESKKDGVLVDSYSYDAFGNRAWKESNGIRTTYSYDVLDRLIKKVETTTDEKIKTTSYSYDRRGNLIKEYENEVLSRSYGFNMQGLLESSVIDPESELRRKISYEYNFAGMRVSKGSDKEKVHYVTDITMDHNNLIMELRGDEVITYTYDEDVVSFDNGKNMSFYQMDELGSTMYLTGTDGVAYCSYAYDVFGNRMDPKTGRSYTKTEDGHKYRKNGNIIQPFAFTGYREEEDGKYYAQVREYDPVSGRFTGEDRVRGIMTIPDTVNHYLYCINDPITYVDNNGLVPNWLKKVGNFFCDVGNGIKNVATKTWNGVKKVASDAWKGIKEDPCKFLAQLGTGVAVGILTYMGATALTAICPPGAPLFYGAATAITCGAVDAAGQFASTKDEENKKFNWKEFASSTIGGFFGGVVFGGIGYLAGDAMGSALMQGGAGAAAGNVGGFVGDIFSQLFSGKPVDIFQSIGAGIFGGVTGGLLGFGFGKIGDMFSNKNPMNPICNNENGAAPKPATNPAGEPAGAAPKPATNPAGESAGNTKPAAPPTNEPAGNTSPGASVNKPAGNSTPRNASEESDVAVAGSFEDITNEAQPQNKYGQENENGGFNYENGDEISVIYPEPDTYEHVLPDNFTELPSTENGGSNSNVEANTTNSVTPDNVPQTTPSQHTNSQHEPIIEEKPSNISEGEGDDGSSLSSFSGDDLNGESSLSIDDIVSSGSHHNEGAGSTVGEQSASGQANTGSREFEHKPIFPDVDLDNNVGAGGSQDHTIFPDIELSDLSDIDVAGHIPITVEENNVPQTTPSQHTNNQHEPIFDDDNLSVDSQDIVDNMANDTQPIFDDDGLSVNSDSIINTIGIMNGAWDGNMSPLVLPAPAIAPNPPGFSLNNPRIIPGIPNARPQPIMNDAQPIPVSNNNQNRTIFPDVELSDLSDIDVAADIPITVEENNVPQTNANGHADLNGESIHENAPASNEASTSGTSSNSEVIRDEVIIVNPIFTHFNFNPFRRGPAGQRGGQTPTPITRGNARREAAPTPITRSRAISRRSNTNNVPEDRRIESATVDIPGTSGNTPEQQNVNYRVGINDDVVSNNRSNRSIAENSEDGFSYSGDEVMSTASDEEYFNDMFGPTTVENPNISIPAQNRTIFSDNSSVSDISVGDFSDNNVFENANNVQQGVAEHTVTRAVSKDPNISELIRLSNELRNQGRIIRVPERVTSLDELPEFHRAAFRAYSEDNSKISNGFKRGTIEKNQMTSDEREVVKLLDEALENAEYQGDGALFRGTKRDELVGGGVKGIPRNGESLANLNTEALKGQRFTQDGYFSSSTSYEHAFPGEVQIRVENPRGSKALEIKSVSNSTGEGEVLFHAGQEFEIIDALLLPDDDFQYVLHIIVRPV